MPIKAADYQAEYRIDVQNAMETLKRIDQKIMQSAEKAEKGFGDKLKSGLKGIDDAIGTTSKLILGGALAAGAALESGFVGVAKTTGIEKGSEAFEKMREDILNVSKEIPVMIPRLLEIGEAAGTLGIAGDEVAAFTKVIAKLDLATTDLKGAEAASQLATILQLSGENIGDVEKLASGLVVLGNNYNTTEGQAAKLAMEITKGLGGFQRSSQSVLALAGTLAEVKVSAELARSNIGAIATVIQDTVITGGEGLDTLAQYAGTTAKEFRKSFEDDAGIAVAQLAKGLADLSTEEKFKFFKDFKLESREVRTIMNALIENTQRTAMITRDMASEYENVTAITKETAAASDTFKSRMVLLSNATLRLGDAVARAGLLDFMSRMVELAIVGADALGALPDPVLQVGLGFLAFAASIGPALKAWEAITKAWKIAKAGFVLLGTVMRAHPIGAIISGVALVAYDLWQAFSGGESVIMGMIEWLDEAADKLLKFLGLREDLERGTGPSAVRFEQGARPGRSDSGLTGIQQVTPASSQGNTTTVTVGEIKQTITTSDPVKAGREAGRRVTDSLYNYGRE